MFRNSEFFRALLMAAAIFAIAVLGMYLLPDGAVVILSLACIGIIAVFGCYTQKRYAALKALAANIHNFQRSQPGIDLEEYCEGELSYLASEINKLCVKLTEQTEMLKADKLYLADAISDISHQLKTPLTSMSMMADFLRDPDLPSAKRELFTSSIRHQLMRIEWLVSALLKMARLDAGAVQLKKEPVNVRQMIAKASEHLLIPMELKEQKFVVSCDPLLTFDGDFDWFSEAVANILKNCTEHMDNGKTLTVNCRKNPLYVMIEITDEGCGIEKEDLPHIFERFYRGKNASSDSVGIGLAMAAQIIHQQNGDIQVESTPGQGTRFMIKLY